MQEQTYDAIADAYPKDPWALISLVVSVMTKGALNDEVSDSFDLIRDFAKLMRDKMQQVNSRNEFKVEYVDSVTGLDVVSIHSMRHFSPY